MALAKKYYYITFVMNYAQLLHYIIIYITLGCEIVGSPRTLASLGAAISYARQPRQQGRRSPNRDCYGGTQLMPSK